MNCEKIVLHQERNVTLTAYLQNVGGEFGFTRRPAILVLPGGGYKICSDREADAVALAYSAAGFQSFVLRYTLKDKGGWPLPLEDYDEAMQLLKTRANDWHIDTDRIAAIGFSAGGHLCACAATMSRHRPAAAILLYPAIVKQAVDLCGPDLPLPVNYVDEKTCPCFLAAARDDRIVRIQNTLAMEMALAEHNIPFESHIYSYGGHGFSTALPWIVDGSVSTRVKDWVADSQGWLAEVLGTLTHNGFTTPEQPAVNLNADHNDVLSVMITIGHAEKQGEDVRTILAPLFSAIQKYAERQGFSYDTLLNAIQDYSVRECMEMLQFPSGQIQEMDHQLRQIANRK